MINILNMPAFNSLPSPFLLFSPQRVCASLSLSPIPLSFRGQTLTRPSAGHSGAGIPHAVKLTFHRSLAARCVLQTRRFPFEFRKLRTQWNLDCRLVANKAVFFKAQSTQLATDKAEVLRSIHLYEREPCSFRVKETVSRKKELWRTSFGADFSKWVFEEILKVKRLHQRGGLKTRTYF